MAIEVKCDGCGKRYSVSDQFAGKKAKCKNCGAVMMVPQLPPPPADPADVDFDALAAMEESSPVDESAAVPFAAPPPLMPSGSAKPAARGRVAPPTLGKVARPPGKRFGFRINRLIALMIFGGGALAFYGFREMRLSSSSSDTPQTLTCQQLETNGPGKNANVHLTNLVYTQGFVYKGNKNDSGEHWTEVWIPIIPTDGAYFKSLAVLVAAGKIKSENEIPPPKDIRVIVKTKHIHNNAELTALAQSKTLDGLVINEVESLGREEQKLLEQAFPSANFSKVYIVEEGRTPMSAGLYLLMIGGGVVIILAGLGFMLKPD